MLKHSIKKAMVGAIALGMAAALTGCSEASAPQAPDADLERTYSEDTINTFLDYTGSTAGAADASLAPVRVAWVNQDTGAGSLPDLTSLMKSMTKLINDELGGIDGHPLELVTCDIASEETGLACGQQFANDGDIVTIAQGNIIAGSESFHQVIDPTGIPIIGAIPLGAPDGMAPNGFYLAPGSFSTVPAMTELVRDYFKPSSVAVLSVEGEFISSMIANQMAQALTAEGVTVSQSSVALTGTDATAPLVASGADKADLVIPLVITPDQCVAIHSALENLGSEADVLALSACYSDGTKAALNGEYPEWTYLFAYTTPAIEDADPRVQAEIAAYSEWYEVLGQEMDAVIPMQTALTIQKHLIASGGAEATPADVVATAKAWTGPIFLGAPTVAYGSVNAPMPLPALPSLSTRAYHYDGGGKFTDMTGGEWVG